MGKIWQCKFYPQAELTFPNNLIKTVALIGEGPFPFRLSHLDFKNIFLGRYFPWKVFLFGIFIEKIENDKLALLDFGK